MLSRLDLSRLRPVGSYLHGAIISLKRLVPLRSEKRKDAGGTQIPKARRQAFRKPRGEQCFVLAKIVAEGDR